MRDPLSQTFAALADPTRRALLARLAEGQADVTQLHKPFRRRMSLPAITKHLKVLEQAGLVTKKACAQRRSCQLNPEALQNAAAWIEQYRAFWEASLDRLGDYLKTITDKTTTKEKQSPSTSARGKKR